MIFPTFIVNQLSLIVDDKSLGESGVGGFILA